MKKALLLFTILIFSSQITLAMKGKTGMRQEEEIEKVAKVEVMLYGDLRKMLVVSDDLVLDFLNDVSREKSPINGIFYSAQNVLNWILRNAANYNYPEKVKFALEHGATHHIYAVFMCTTTRDTHIKKTILSNCVFQPHPKCIAASRKTCITFLCYLKRISIPKDVQTLILQHLEETGNCMIDRALKGKPIPQQFMPVIHKTLCATTLKELRRLVREELEEQNEINYIGNVIKLICPECHLTKEIQETVTRRLQAPKLICNGISEDFESKESWCAII